MDLEEAVGEGGPHPEVGRVEVTRGHGHCQHRRLRVGQEVAATRKNRMDTKVIQCLNTGTTDPHPDPLHMVFLLS